LTGFAEVTKVRFEIDLGHVLGVEADFDLFVNGFGEFFDRCEETV
jgi:hypothetical protein